MKAYSFYVLSCNLIFLTIVLLLQEVDNFKIEPLDSRYDDDFSPLSLLFTPKKRTSSGNKRGGACSGFPCVFTHMGSKMGDAAIRKLHLATLKDCIGDPDCSPYGKRSSGFPTFKKRQSFRKPYDYARSVNARQFLEYRWRPQFLFRYPYDLFSTSDQ